MFIPPPPKHMSNTEQLGAYPPPPKHMSNTEQLGVYSPPPKHMSNTEQLGIYPSNFSNCEVLYDLFNIKWFGIFSFNGKNC